MRYHCLQHVAFETPGLIANWIGERGDVLSFTGLFQNDPLPAIHEFDGLVIMGGPMSIHDEGELAWLKKEKELITAALREKKKVLGICLGAQLVAEALGAKVYPNSQKEIGFWPLHWTKAARSWLGFSCQPGGEEEPGSEGRADAAGGWPTESLVFHWHGETFDLPEGSIHLAFTAACPNQGFLLGETALGLQFHPELTPAMVREMMVYEGHELASAGMPTASADTHSAAPLAPYIQSETAILDQLSSLKGNEKLLYPLLDRFFHGLRPE
ncbi:MAG TPA: type 1 glutamine amidotransferase [Puia sp.]|nr:type 1 glutamine amidotransferase [Puia sp.]